jgi:CheY-like chemotaxis protein
MGAKKPKSKFEIVMLIDDSEIDNFINVKMLEGCNFANRIYIHTSGKSAIEFLNNIERVGEKSLYPEIIFLDLNMPIMDGYQFIDEFEKMQPALKNKTKIVILTTSLNPSDMEKANECTQVIKYINKPLTCEVLNIL